MAFTRLTGKNLQFSRREVARAVSEEGRNMDGIFRKHQNTQHGRVLVAGGKMEVFRLKKEARDEVKRTWYIKLRVLYCSVFVL